MNHRYRERRPTTLSAGVCKSLVIVHSKTTDEEALVEFASGLAQSTEISYLAAVTSPP